jgi:hypothetical protein
MNTKFEGTFEQLHQLFNTLGIEGCWEPEPNGVYMVRCACGANMHWASTSKSIWFDGNSDAVRLLQQRLIEGVASGGAVARC